ncbi:hypothetical protein [Pseudokineococcus lusitanus]|uniref:Uncharacterized protein n=1 Tax=Pseudokineococcus lusitanus TaxID=763993 RepID=A0A3N1HRB8_9ACTN|nr:hypothetical protein [Pseudokineococcus lusitanus]ROP44942.1 hypothetical protein EDC03_1072 [Pseudokineococcus lusitanus]
MNPIRFVRALPQPTRTVYALFLGTVVVAFAVMFAVGATGGDAFVAIAVPGALMVLVGVLQLLDVRGTASAMARHIAESRPMGVDYSRSFMSTPRYVRLLGLGLVVIGLFWCALGLGLVG